MTLRLKALHALSRKHSWLVWPLSSATLLTLSFHPFHLWPLGCVALAPLIYFAERDHSSSVTRLFFAGFIVGSVFPLALMYTTVMEFTWLPEAHLFQTAVRWLSLPIALSIGLLHGGAVLGYAKKLRTASITKNAVVFAVIWSLAEWLTTLGTGGYNLGMLARTVATVPFFTSLAAVGGIHFVSFTIIICNAYLAFLPLARKEPYALPLWRYLIPVGGTAIIIITIFFVNTWYLRHDQTEHIITVAVLQNNARRENAFGTFSHTAFSFEKLSLLIREAEKSKPTPAIIVYPFAVSKEILTASTSSLPYVATAPLSVFRDWAMRLGSTTLVTWNTIERDGLFFNEIDYWTQGALVAKYQKAGLFPFMDYTPLWAQRIGLYSTVVDETPGVSPQPALHLSNARIASAVCSEITSAQRLRTNTQGVNILFSIGSDAMFSDSFAAEFDLASAQFRAAENNVAIVRANRFGPSGFIGPDGRLMRKTQYNEDGMTVFELPYEATPRKTFYNLVGNAAFVYGGLLLLLFMQ